MKKTTLSFYLLISLTLIVGYSNCSQFKMADATRDLAGASSTFPIITGSGGDDYQVPDANGMIPAFQDRLFRLKIPRDTTSATFSASNLPSWITFSATTGELAGVPLVMQNYSNIILNVTEGGQTKILGPYTIKVIGNPLKQYQWHLKNSGQTAFAALGGTAGEDIHSDVTIQSGILGKGIKIAISDSGVLESHRGLAPNLLSSESRNYLNDFATTGTWLGNSTPNTADPVNAHGTGVAGAIAERGWTDFGGRGVAPLASISGFLFIQAQTQLAAKGYLTTGIYDQFAGNFDIFNFSWGDPQCYFAEYPDAYSAKLQSGVTSLRGGRGAIYVMAAGNDYYGHLKDCQPTAADADLYLGNANHSELATTPFTILVSAVNADGVSSSYSSPGANNWIAAPGGEFGLTNTSSTYLPYKKPAIISTDFIGCSIGLKTTTAANTPFNQGASPNTDCEHDSTFNGTSAATPIVSGAVALMLNANPNLGWRDVKHILAVTADKVDPSSGPSPHPVASSNLTGHTYEQGWVTNAAGYKFHNWYGFGRVHVDRAVAMAKTYVSSLGSYQTTGWKYSSGNLNATVPAGNATGYSNSLNVTENWKVEAVQVKVNAQSCLGHVGMEITSPSGTKSILLNINNSLLDTAMTNHVMLSNAFYGENSAGNWTFKVISGDASCAPTLVSWQLNISGH